jgi:demethylmenaquinone methyltransferase/2-methoxy-6-polyprenyl-1,4-benzoquinol methylase
MTKPPLTPSSGRKTKVEAMFNDIASSYDFLNHFLSAGIDRRWRKALIKKLSQNPHDHILDIATGTGDLAIAASKLTPVKITGIDIAGEMLAVGREKIRKKGLDRLITLVKGDSENIPFDDHSFDVAMVAFGVRNFENLSKGLSEMYRVLKPKGAVFILEFSTPGAFPVKQLYRFYFRYVLPVLGRIVSKNPSAYTYLPETVYLFPQGEEFLDIMKNTGFTGVSVTRLSFGIASIYMGYRK